MVKGKTIQIYLPDGNPRGVKIAEIMASLGKAVSIPRSRINDVSNRPELQGVGIYFLFGEANELGEPKVYIGEAETIITRIKQHNSSKDFWNVAIAFMSGKNNLNKAHVKFLENYCCNKAKEINRCELENSVNPTKSSLTESEEDLALSFFDDLRVILGALGYQIFEEIKREKGKQTYFCKSKFASAEGEYTKEGFVVFKGSKANKEGTPAFETTNWPKVRQKLIDKGILKEEGDIYLFTDDFLFSSPSAAAAIVVGRSANGWTGWKTNEGKTLDEVERKNDTK